MAMNTVCVTSPYAVAVSSAAVAAAASREASHAEMRSGEGRDDSASVS